MAFLKQFYQTCVRGYRSMSFEARRYLRYSVTKDQGSGGFFCGRAGQEDLYYTFFGLLLAAVTGAKVNCKECAVQMKNIDFATLDIVHACSWLRMNRLLQLLAWPGIFRNRLVSFPFKNVDCGLRTKLESLATRPDEDYPHQDMNSPYSRFLVSTLYADFGINLPRSDFQHYRLPNGLYSNLTDTKEYAVNATTAVLFLLPETEREITAEVLLKCQEPNGSFKAMESAPSGDLMSTATAFFTLRNCDKMPRLSVKSFLRDCFRENGFFAATPDDPGSDLEYTVYGLLTMGVIAS